MLLPTTKTSWLLQTHNRAVCFCFVLPFLLYQHHELAEGTELQWHFVAPMHHLNFRAHEHLPEATLTSCSLCYDLHLVFLGSQRMLGILVSLQYLHCHGPGWKTPKRTLGFSQLYMALWIWRSLPELYNSVSWYYSQSQLLFLFSCSTPACKGFCFAAT